MSWEISKQCYAVNKMILKTWIIKLNRIWHLKMQEHVRYKRKYNICTKNKNAQKKTTGSNQKFDKLHLKIVKLYIVLSSANLNLFMHNVPKWSDTL